MNNAIFLVGARGSGKTTVGQQLSKNLNYTFVDTDSYIVNKVNSTISDLVALYGWDTFRALESQSLIDVTQPQTIVATGGGMILSEKNRDWMKSHGVVFYLATSAEVLSQRLLQDPNNEQRPSLTGLSIADEIGQILQARETLYRSTAHYVVDANLPLDDIVQFIKSKSVPV